MYHCFSSAWSGAVPEDASWADGHNHPNHFPVRQTPPTISSQVNQTNLSVPQPSVLTPHLLLQLLISTYYYYYWSVPAITTTDHWSVPTTTTTDQYLLLQLLISTYYYNYWSVLTPCTYYYNYWSVPTTTTTDQYLLLQLLISPHPQYLLLQLLISPHPVPTTTSTDQSSPPVPVLISPHPPYFYYNYWLISPHPVPTTTTYWSLISPTITATIKVGFQSNRTTTESFSLLHILDSCMHFSNSCV